MIHRPYDEAAIYANFAGFNAWKVRAQRAKDAVCTAVAAGVKPTFDSGVWQSLKDHQLDYFHGKCAYCEIRITPGFWGDVEHFRPKRRVDDDPAHPGYYWLAYAPQNLLPSCARCNGASAKGSRFPVTATRWRREAEPCVEDALLLNPYFDKPRVHIEFVFDFQRGAPTGHVRGITDKGRASVEIYRLDRAAMVEDRRDAQLSTVTEYESAYFKDRGSEYIAQVVQARLSYTAARLSAIHSWIEWTRRRMDSHGRTIEGAGI